MFKNHCNHFLKQNIICKLQIPDTDGEREAVLVNEEDNLPTHIPDDWELPELEDEDAPAFNGKFIFLVIY